MQVVWDAVRNYAELYSKHGTNARRRIQVCVVWGLNVKLPVCRGAADVLKPMEAFEAAYSKPVRDLDSLKLEEEHFQTSPVKMMSHAFPLWNIVGRKPHADNISS